MVDHWSVTDDGWAVGEAARALGGLRSIAFPTHYPEDTWSFMLDHMEDTQYPLLPAGMTKPIRKVHRPLGVVWIFQDRSGLALRRSRSGKLHLPNWPLFSETWNAADVDAALDTHWRPAHRGPRSTQDWCAQPTPLDSITPWCPAVSAPPDLWNERLAAMDLCRALLWERWQGHPGAGLARSELAFTAIRQNGAWRSDLPLCLHSPLLTDANWHMAKHPGDVDAVRVALERAAHALFPGRLGVASAFRPGASLHHEVVTQTLMVLKPIFPKPLTSHQRLAAHAVLHPLGVLPALAPFLDV